MSETRPAIFLDRDGTIIRDTNYISDPDDVELIPGSGVAIARLNRLHLPVIIITNQSGIGRGYFTPADYDAVNAALLDQLVACDATIDAIYHCPLAPTVKDKRIIEHADRKPGPGMLQRAAREHGLDLEKSWMVGDSISDIDAGLHAGCAHRVLVRTGHYDAAFENDPAVTAVVDDLAAAADLIAATLLR